MLIVLFETSKVFHHVHTKRLSPPSPQTLGVPSPPVGPLRFSNITSRSAHVSWKASEKDGGSPIVHYVVEKRVGWKSSWVPVERCPNDKFHAELYNLKIGEEVYCRVYAENKAGQSLPLEGDEVLVPKSPYSEYHILTDFILKILLFQY